MNRDKSNREMGDQEKQDKEGKGALEVTEERAPFHWAKWSFWKRLIFIDTDLLIHFGYKNILQPMDMYQEPVVRSEPLNAAFIPSWEAQLQKPKPSLRIAIWAGNVPTLIFTAFLYGISQACSLAGPILLQRIVAGIACQPYINSPGSSCEPKNQLY